MSEIVLVRHGETAWSATGRHTSVTDLPLTSTGEDQARSLKAKLRGRHFAAVWTSPRLRAQRTAELAGLRVTGVDEDLAEWAYGGYEGITTAEIWEGRPDWDLWRDGCPGGESPEEVGARADRVLAAALPLLADGDVALVGHGHCLRVCAARWIGLPPSGGGRLRLDTSTVSVLGFERSRQVLLKWNS
ncbi:histidine phosphatase family protein [Longispora albida]|uniref:histidine phosphatase family protein n=1 Tax=Longispora albida TaxID=203523 RepID=UPI0003670E75|nr:histidine phosphatase family protein [Longispora albida]